MTFHESKISDFDVELGAKQLLLQCMYQQYSRVVITHYHSYDTHKSVVDEPKPRLNMLWHLYWHQQISSRWASLNPDRNMLRHLLPYTYTTEPPPSHFSFLTPTVINYKNNTVPKGTDIIGNV